MDEVEVVVAHAERATLRVGDVFLKVDSDRRRLETEVEAMSLAPVPTPAVLWSKPPVLAIAAVPGAPIGRLGGPSTGSAAEWAAAGAAIRQLHDAPLPPWTGRAGRPVDALADELDAECDVLVRDEVLPPALVARNRDVAHGALRPRSPAFTHGDLQIAHVFVDVGVVTGIIDWSEAGQGDALYDLATFTLGHETRLRDVVAGYGGDVDVDVVRGWWSVRSLLGIRWLVEHGFDPFAPGCEVDVLRARM